MNGRNVQVHRFTNMKKSGLLSIDNGISNKHQSIFLIFYSKNMYENNRYDVAIFAFPYRSFDHNNRLV